ncbi:MAG: glycosyltransferase family 8 protein [Pseudonocardia sp.]
MNWPEEVPIVCGLDRAYLPPFLTMITSLSRSHGAAVASLWLVILHDELTPHDRQAVLDTAARAGLSAELRQVATRHEEWPVSGWVSPAVYLRLTAAESLPEFTRALYLDVDTLVLRDLRPLLATDLGGAPLGAVRDPQNPVLKSGIALPGWAELGLPGEREYFNSGVMLLDLDVCRRTGLFERASSFLTCHPSSARFWDQDALNWAADDSWCRLERQWNTFALTPLIDRGRFVHYAEHIIPLSELVDDERGAAVLHFAGPDKPWRDGYPPGPFLDLYRAHAAGTTVAGESHA